MSSIAPFDFLMNLQPGVGAKCSGCRVYYAKVELLDGIDLALCEVCLNRMRTTLKSALKLIPPKPKVERPKED